jgi:hypothetical protein
MGYMMEESDVLDNKMDMGISIILNVLSHFNSTEARAMLDEIVIAG